MKNNLRYSWDDLFSRNSWNSFSSIPIDFLIIFLVFSLSSGFFDQLHAIESRHWLILFSIFSILSSINLVSCSLKSGISKPKSDATTIRTTQSSLEKALLALLNSFMYCCPNLSGWVFFTISLKIEWNIAASSAICCFLSSFLFELSYISLLFKFWNCISSLKSSLKVFTYSSNKILWSSSSKR